MNFFQGYFLKKWSPLPATFNTHPNKVETKKGFSVRSQVVDHKVWALPRKDPSTTSYQLVDLVRLARYCQSHIRLCFSQANYNERYKKITSHSPAWPTRTTTMVFVATETTTVVNGLIEFSIRQAIKIPHKLRELAVQ